MAKILLDYFFPITVITPTPSASTGFLKRVVVVAKPKAGQEANVGDFFTCSNSTQVAARTDNTNATQLFDAGLTQIFLLLADDLQLATFLLEKKGEYFTLLITDDFDDEEIETVAGTAEIPAVKAEIKIQDILFRARNAGTGGNAITINYDGGDTAGSESVTVLSNAITITIEDGESTAQQIADAIAASGAADALVECIVDDGDEADKQDIFGAAVSLAGGAALTPAVPAEGLDFGTFDGVTGISTQDAEFAAEQGAIENRCAFLTHASNGAKNMFYAFGKLLANGVNWLDQQYIEMPFDDQVDELPDAINLFNDRVSFVISDDEYGERLSFFVAGGKAITAPYKLKNFRVDLQSRALQWVSANMPDYTEKNASLLETRLTEDVLNDYIQNKKWLSGGVVRILLEADNFVATGAIEVPTPKALWRVEAQMIQS